MPRVRLAVLLLGLGLLASCRIEDRTPTGSREDETRIRAVINGYYRDVAQREWERGRSAFWPGASVNLTESAGPRPGVRVYPVDSAMALWRQALEGVEPGGFDAQVIRVDLRQQSDLAAAWVTVRLRLPSSSSATERERIEHLVLRRIGSEWRIANLSLAPPGGP